MTDKLIYAQDCICCEKDCNEKAVAFWPIVDPDIPSHPYCRKHLDEAKMRLQIAIWRADQKRENKKRNERQRNHKKNV